LAHPVSARLTPAELRRFGLVVGAAFLVLGGIIRWRGMPPTSLVLWSIGAALILSGLLIPGRLGPVYRAWMGLALLISRVTTPIIMGVLYFLIITPLGLILRATGHRPLTHGAEGKPVWITREGDDRRRKDMERQF
jgi:hypothetical protein